MQNECGAWLQNQWLLIRDDFTGLWLDCLHISFSSCSKRTHITKNIQVDWTGSGANITCLHCVAWDYIRDIIHACASRRTSPRLQMRPPSVCHKDQENVPVPWGWRRKQLWRNKLLILMFQEKEKRERTWGAQKEWLHMALMCSFPQDGSSTENTE